MTERNICPAVSNEQKRLNTAGVTVGSLSGLTNCSVTDSLGWVGLLTTNYMPIFVISNLLDCKKNVILI